MVRSTLRIGEVLSRDKALIMPSLNSPVSPLALDLARVELGTMQVTTPSPVLINDQTPFQFSNQNHHHHHLDQNQNHHLSKSGRHYENEQNYQNQQYHQKPTSPASPAPDVPLRPIMRPTQPPPNPPRRQHSFRHRLSRTLSYPRRRWEDYYSTASKSSPACNSTACVIGLCFALALLALIISLFNAYMYNQYHGFGPASLTPSGGDRDSHNMAQYLRDPSGDENAPSQMTAPTQMTDEDDHGGADREGERRHRAYAHIVGAGQGTGMDDELFRRLVVWEKNVTHNVVFQKGSGLLKIQQPGVYYVYSQVYLTDPEDTGTDPETGAELPMYFSTNLNDVAILESVAPFKEFSTKYHGGVFHLNAGDKIGVALANNKLRMSRLSDRSFFGVFMINGS